MLIVVNGIVILSVQTSINLDDKVVRHLKISWLKSIHQKLEHQMV